MVVQVPVTAEFGAVGKLVVESRFINNMKINDRKDKNDRNKNLEEKCQTIFLYVLSGDYRLPGMTANFRKRISSFSESIVSC